MAGLQEGHRYSLSTEHNNNKSVIFVKLTDSAIQCIESFCNSKDGSSSKSTIQFQGNSGIISLPLYGQLHNYGFTLSNIEIVGQQSSFQCLQSTNDSSLESLGFMFMKMQILATEDSYEKTKSKMEAADQEQKNLCTKYTRQTANRSGKKANVKCSRLQQILDQTQPNVLKSEPSNMNLKNKMSSSVNLIQQPVRQRIIHILAAKPYKKAELLLRLKREGISDKDKDQINNILVEVAKLKGNIFTLENHIWNEVQDDWEFSSKEELQLIKRKKQQFLKLNTLNGVIDPSKSMVNHVNRVTGLSKRLAHQVNLSEPLVNQKDKPVLEKKLVNNKRNRVNAQNSKLAEKPNLTSKGILEVSQPAINGKIPSLQTSFVQQQHRTNGTSIKTEEEMCIEIPRHGNDIDAHRNRASNSTISSSVSSCKKAERSNVSRIQVKQSNNCSETNGSGYPGYLSVLQKINSLKQQLQDDSSQSHKKMKMCNNINGSNSEIRPVAESPLNFPEIQLKYTKIESHEQRSQYCKDFTDDYEEYLKLRTEMQENSDRFSALLEHLNTCTEGSPEYEAVEKAMKEEYKEKERNGYFDSRKRFEFLKTKLSHIKELVQDYDKNVQCN